MENHYDSPILIVDDNADLMSAYNYLLSRNGYKVTCTETGKGALELVENEAFDLILLDVVLPDISGIEILKIIKSNPEHENIFVVLISSLAITSENQSEGLETGADGYLLKPLENREFLARIDAFIRHKRTMDKLRASEIKFKMLANSNIDGILIVDSENRIRFANPAAEELFKNGNKTLVDSVFDNLVAENGILEISADSGSCKKAEILSNELEWEGKPMKLISLRDITERLQAQQELRESEEKFRNIFENSVVGKSLTSIDGKMQTNNAFCQILGYPEGYLFEINWQDITHPDDIEFNQKILDSIFSGERSVAQWEKRFYHKNGNIIWADISTTLQRDKLGNPLYFITAINDITKRKQAEEALIESERFLRESQAIARLGSFVWDLSTGSWESSTILDEIFGIDANYSRTLEGWVNIVHPGWQEMMTDYVMISVLGKHQKFDKEYLIIRQDDRQERWVQGIAELELDHNNNPLRLIGTISDITGRKQSEEVLTQKIDELERFNDLTVGRELKMIELKKEINTLIKMSGGKEKYKIVGE